jgi:RHS repeat-associated protein
MIALRTYQGLAHGIPPTLATVGFAETAWSYHSERTWLLEKNHHGETGNGPGTTADYSYTAAGRLKTRTWERGVVTTYVYDKGSLDTVTYTNDPTNTPNLAYTYDSFGRPTIVAQSKNGTGTATLATITYGYDPVKLALASETTAYDTDADGTAGFTRTLNRYLDSDSRPVSSEISGEYTAAFGYDPAGRLNRVWEQPTLDVTTHLPSVAADFTYGYQANSYGLVKTVTGPAHTVTNTWEGTRNVLDTKRNDVTVGTPSVPSSFDYTVNNLGQRTHVGPMMDSEDPPAPISTYSVAWEWNYNSRGELESADHGDDDTANASDSFYKFDAIGNRDYVRTGVSADSGGTQIDYTANPLNQYTKADGVTLPVSAYDLDGNHTSGPLPVATGNATLVWDAENRLVKITRSDNKVIIYNYDAQSRRISKQVDGGTPTHYLYDGWNLIAEYTGTTLTATYTWGMDLSGSMQGAGGVGGLLAVKQGTASYYPTFDGNGNVSEYLGSTGAVRAHYEYDAFGNLTVEPDKTATGFIEFAHKFSTKPQDQESGLYYYGYRYYDPVTGRWPSRDPIEELGGTNLYGMVLNGSVNRIDVLGLCEEGEVVYHIIDINDIEIRIHHLNGIGQSTELLEWEIDDLNGTREIGEDTFDLSEDATNETIPGGNLKKALKGKKLPGLMDALTGLMKIQFGVLTKGFEIRMNYDIYYKKAVCKKKWFSCDTYLDWEWLPEEIWNIETVVGESKAEYGVIITNDSQGMKLLLEELQSSLGDARDAVINDINEAIQTDDQ